MLVYPEMEALTNHDLQYSNSHYVLGHKSSIPQARHGYQDIFHKKIETNMCPLAYSTSRMYWPLSLSSAFSRGHGTGRHTPSQTPGLPGASLGVNWVNSHGVHGLSEWQCHHHKWWNSLQCRYSSSLTWDVPNKRYDPRVGRMLKLQAVTLALDALVNTAKICPIYILLQTIKWLPKCSLQGKNL